MRWVGRNCLRWSIAADRHNEPPERLFGRQDGRGPVAAAAAAAARGKRHLADGAVRLSLLAKLRAIPHRGLTMHQRLHWVLLLGAIYTCSAIPAQRYTITDLGTMGLDTAQATGIDAKGTVVGFAETSRLFGKYEVRPFIYTDGSMVNLHDTILRALPKACHFDNQLHPTITDSGLVRGWA